MEPGFEEALSAFCRRHMHEFNDSEESKLSHHDTFQEYVALVEASLETRLAARLPDFDMARFLQVRARQPHHGLAANCAVPIVVLRLFCSEAHLCGLKSHMLDYIATSVQWVEAQPAEALGSDVLDTLLSATDFQAFKAHVLSFKSEGALAGLAPSARGVASAASH